jgi:hypothetical protein
LYTENNSNISSSGNRNANTEIITSLIKKFEEMYKDNKSLFSLSDQQKVKNNITEIKSVMVDNKQGEGILSEIKQRIVDTIEIVKPFPALVDIGQKLFDVVVSKYK